MASCDAVADLGLQSEPEVAPVKITDPFPAAVSVRLFVESGEVDEDGRGIMTKPEGLLLTDKQRIEVESTFQFEPMPEAFAACFVPHHFFEYYDAAGERIGEVAVCFCCDGVSADGSDKLIAGADQIIGADYEKLKELIEGMGERTDVMCY
ncbi:MAG: hypothetical protein AAF687_01640 [Pseudomonadota bacterium]